MSRKPQNSPQTKVCSRCKASFPLGDFYKNKQHSSGYKSACKKCSSKDFRKWRHSNIEEIRKQDRVTYYVRKYGMDKNKALALVQDRTGLCEICNSEVELVVDHNHTTGQVRGMICSHCNSALGYSRESPLILQEIISYLEKYNGR